MPETLHPSVTASPSVCIHFSSLLVKILTITLLQGLEMTSAPSAAIQGDGPAPKSPPESLKGSKGHGLGQEEEGGLLGGCSGGGLELGWP